MRPNHFCPNCGPVTITPAQQFAGKLAFSAAGALLGLKAAKDPMVAVVCALVGLGVGHVIDQRCPQCGAVLQLAQTFLG